MFELPHNYSIALISYASNGEGNSNPLQYSCLENPIDGGAWWAASPWGHKESDMTERPSTFTWFKKKKLPFLQPTCFKARTIFLPHTLSFPK